LLLGLATRSVHTEEHIALSSAQARKIQSIKSVLIERASENVAVTELASEVGWSPYHLARLFRLATGQSIREFRLMMRISIALERLSRGTDDLTELALELGFANHAHLTSSFQRILGVSPSEARKEFRRSDVRTLRRQLAS
jgi:transcriptional regulator GlxA family with amidase domain